MKVKSVLMIVIFATFVLVGKAWANSIVQVPFTFTSLTEDQLDWSDSDDDNGTDFTALGFTVTLEGRDYSYFDMDSNGYIQLLGENEEPSYYGLGDVGGLLYDDYDDDYVLNNTYILAAYDDLTSEYHGYYGYKIDADKIIFYYNTETYADANSGRLSEFEVMLYKDGRIRWNFNSANYEEYDYDLFSGLYLTNPDTHYVAVLPADTGEIPSQTSYLYGSPVPIPGAIWLLGSGLIGLVAIRRRRKPHSPE